MVNGTRSLLVGGLGVMLLCAGLSARAQQVGNSSEAIGPPQLKDFSLTPRERLVTQPAPAPAPAEVTPQPAPVAGEPRAERPAAPAPAGSAPERRPAPSGTAAAPGRSAIDAPLSTIPVDSGATPGPMPAPVADVAELPAAIPSAETNGLPSFWYYALPAAALALLGVALVRRRRLAPASGPAEAPAPLAATPPPRPRPDPVPRPWLELSLKAERCAFTATEAEVLFELEIANKGGSEARNLRLDVKMFNAGAEQDREIGAFFRTAGRETTKLNLPGVEAGVVGVIHGSVRLPVDQMKAMKLDERLLFIPVVAVNALYDWGEGRTGQTSQSYVIGRELEQPSDKMGAFRVDQGPRVWRSVGQRRHKLAKRV
jgi:hypothetical protein